MLGGEQGLDLAGMLQNIQHNPFSYGLAFIGTLLWAAYCTLTARIAQGTNGITLFFILVSVVLWIKYALMGAAVLILMGLLQYHYFLRQQRWALVMPLGMLGFCMAM